MKLHLARLDRRVVAGGLAAASASIAFLISAVAARGQCQVGHLFADDGASGDFFGYDVAISGDTFIVSAIADDTLAGTDAGSAYVFVRTGEGWVQQAHLFPNPPGAGDQFGYSVAIDGDTAVVGADWDDTAGTNAGSATVFVRDANGAWWQQAQLLAPDAAAFDLLGVSVAISGDTIIVGAPGNDTPAGTNAGSAYVFNRSGTVWTYWQTLYASDAAQGDFFSGYAIEIEGDTAVIGAINDDTPNGGTNAGSAYVFVRNQFGSWTQQAHLFASDEAPNQKLGYSADISGDTIVVGRIWHDPPDGTQPGSAYVFRRNGTNWNEEQKLMSPNPAPGEAFGFSVAVEGETTVVGASWDPSVSATHVGSAYTFVRNGTVWTHREHIVPTDAVQGNIFGISAAMSGDTTIIGAASADTPIAVDAGSAYVFDLSCNPQGDLNCDNAVNFADVPHFIEALLATGFTGCNLNRSDMNADGLIDGRDTWHFVEVLTAP